MKFRRRNILQNFNFFLLFILLFIFFLRILIVRKTAKIAKVITSKNYRATRYTCTIKHLKRVFCCRWLRLQNSRSFFFLLARSQRREASEAWILAREMRELHTPYGHEARKKDCRLCIQQIRSDRGGGSKIPLRCQKLLDSSTHTVNLIQLDVLFLR